VKSFIGGAPGFLGSGTADDLGIRAVGSVLFATNGSSVDMTLDSSGNLGLGVTPSTWYSLLKAFDVGSNAAAIYSGGITHNAYFDNTDVRWEYKNSSSSPATFLNIQNGQFAFNIAVAGTAGNDIPFIQAMTLDASGNLGVGTTSPAYKLQVGKTDGTANVETAIFSGASYGVQTIYGLVGTSTFVVGNNNSGSAHNGLPTGTAGMWMVQAYPLVFGTNGSERARITSGGYFKASNDGNYVEASQCHELRTTEDARAAIITATNASYTSDIIQIRATRNTTGNSFYAIGYYNTGAAAYKFRVADSGDVTNTNGTYGTISDQKMKTDIVDAGSQWSDIKALRFRKFKMKDDPSGLVQLGVVAQEVELTSPGLVDEHQDRDAEGNDLGTTTKSVKTSVLLMKAAVALQEAMARIETLEAKIAALEAK